MITSFDNIEQILGKTLPECWPGQYGLFDSNNIDDSSLYYPSEEQMASILESLATHYEYFSLPDNTRNEVWPVIRTRIWSNPNTSLNLDTLGGEFLKRAVRSDDYFTAKRCLVFSDGAILFDPFQGFIDFVLDWKLGWRSAVFWSLRIYEFVKRGLVIPAPLGRLGDMGPKEQLLIEIGQRDNIRKLYASFGDKFGNSDEFGVALLLGLEQFAHVSDHLPNGTPFLPFPECLTAIQSVETQLSSVMTEHYLVSLHLNCLNSEIGIDPSHLNDRDIISMHENEELFATWRAICREVIHHSVTLTLGSQSNRASMVQLLDDSRKRWNSEIERRVGKSSVLEGALDKTSVSLGIMGAAVAAGTGIEGVMIAAAAAAGGVAAPLLQILFSAVEKHSKRAEREALKNHFLALGGPSRA